MHKVRCRLYIATSLDGFIADRDGSVKWLEPFQDQDYGYESFFAEIGALVMGRRTWDQAGELADHAGRDKPVLILAHSAPDDLPDGVEVRSGDVGELCAELRRELEGDVWVMGGADVIRRFLAADELDEMELHVVPLLLGAGLPLFPDFPQPRGLRLVDTREFPNGVVQMRYERPR